MVKDSENWSKMYGRILKLREKLTEEEPVCFEGRSWLSLWLALGYAFRSPRNFQVSVAQRNGVTQKDEVWRPDPRQERIPLQEFWEGNFDGGDLVVSIAISRDFHKGVANYRSSHLELLFLPWLQLGFKEAHRESVANGKEAAGFANWIIAKLQDLHCLGKIHLLISGPAALAFMVGNGLSASGKIQVYENQNPGYSESFLLE